MKMRPSLAAALLLPALLLPSAALAVGPEYPPAEPDAGETVTQCEDGFIYDETVQRCVAATDDGVRDDARLRAAHQLAYHGRPAAASAVLASLAMPQSSRAQTMLGFAARKQGRMTEAMAHYGRALAADPDNLQARAYLGQGLIDSGDLAGALRQLREIEARAGLGTWAHASLHGALRGLQTDY